MVALSVFFAILFVCCYFFPKTFKTIVWLAILGAIFGIKTLVVVIASLLICRLISYIEDGSS
jgi:hypothetical protein